MQRASSQEEIARRQEEEQEDLVLEQLAGQKMPWHRYSARIDGEFCSHRHESIKRALDCLASWLRMHLNRELRIGWEWIRKHGVSAEEFAVEIAIVDERGIPVSYENVKLLHQERLF